ncbi:MAG TPA: hypothetical protein VMM13_06825 [Euzebya sp.]|nr:hypothetical protein [Euzebya sp.]
MTARPHEGEGGSSRSDDGSEEPVQGGREDPPPAESEAPLWPYVRNAEDG